MRTMRILNFMFLFVFANSNLHRSLLGFKFAIKYFPFNERGAPERSLKDSGEETAEKDSRRIHPVDPRRAEHQLKLFLSEKISCEPVETARVDRVEIKRNSPLEIFSHLSCV